MGWNDYRRIKLSTGTPPLMRFFGTLKAFKENRAED